MSASASKTMTTAPRADRGEARPTPRLPEAVRPVFVKFEEPEVPVRGTLVTPEQATAGTPNER